MSNKQDKIFNLIRNQQNAKQVICWYFSLTKLANMLKNTFIYCCWKYRWVHLF